LSACKNNPSIVKRLKENPNLVESVVNVYMYGKRERALSLMNAGGMGGAYGAPY